MARRATATKSGGVVVVNAPAPARRRRSYRRAAARTRRAGRRVSRAYSGASLQSQMGSLAVGGFAVGFVEKSFGSRIPSLPLVGRKGAIALAVYFLKPKSKLIQDIGKSAAVLSGYELAKTGAVSGDLDADYEDYDDEFFQTT